MKDEDCVVKEDELDSREEARRTWEIDWFGSF